METDKCTIDQLVKDGKITATAASCYLDQAAMMRGSASSALSTNTGIADKYATALTTISRLSDKVRLALWTGPEPVHATRVAEPMITVDPEPVRRGRGRPRKYFEPEQYAQSFKPNMSDDDFNALLTDALMRRIEFACAKYDAGTRDLIRITGEQAFRINPAIEKAKVKKTKSLDYNMMKKRQRDTPKLPETKPGRPYYSSTNMTFAMMKIRSMPRCNASGEPFNGQYYITAIERMLMKMTPLSIMVAHELRIPGPTAHGIVEWIKPGQGMDEIQGFSAEDHARKETAKQFDKYEWNEGDAYYGIFSRVRDAEGKESSGIET